MFVALRKEYLYGGGMILTKIILFGNKIANYFLVFLFVLVILFLRTCVNDKFSISNNGNKIANYFLVFLFVLVILFLRTSPSAYAIV